MRFDLTIFWEKTMNSNQNLIHKTKPNNFESKQFNDDNLFKKSNFN